MVVSARWATCCSPDEQNTRRDTSSGGAQAPGTGGTPPALGGTATGELGGSGNAPTPGQGGWPVVDVYNAGGAGGENTPLSAQPEMAAAIQRHDAGCAAACAVALECQSV